MAVFTVKTDFQHIVIESMPCVILIFCRLHFKPLQNPAFFLNYSRMATDR